MDNGEIQVSRLHRFDGDSKLKAFADISFGGIVIKGLSVVDGSKGLFVSMPRHQGKDGKWYDTACAITDEAKQALTETVLKAYEDDDE